MSDTIIAEWYISSPNVNIMNTKNNILMITQSDSVAICAKFCETYCFTEFDR